MFLTAPKWIYVRSSVSYTLLALHLPLAQCSATITDLCHPTMVDLQRERQSPKNCAKKQEIKSTATLILSC